tara:strand:- start:5701 stop:6630 length:930 start_codon:yes stop_codon:yes gene_type:complete
MLTIIVFTQNEGQVLNNILGDLNKIDNKIPIEVWVVIWGKLTTFDKKVFITNKNKTLKVFKCNLKTFGERYFNWVKKVKTKYLWNVGDDDRINYKNYPILENAIIRNYTGITMSFIAFTNRVNFKKNNNYKITDIKMKKDIHLTGFITSQIINVEILRKNLIFQKKFKITMYPQLFYIFFLIFKKGNWKCLQVDLVRCYAGNFRYINRNSALDRLNNEYQGYLFPLKKYSPENPNVFRLYYEKIFFKNILSWINLNIRLNGKKSTYKLIKNNNYLKPFSLNVTLVSFIIFLMPNKLLNIIFKIIKKPVK